MPLKADNTHHRRDNHLIHRNKDILHRRATHHILNRVVTHHHPLRASRDTLHPVDTLSRVIHLKGTHRSSSSHMARLRLKGNMERLRRCKTSKVTLRKEAILLKLGICRHISSRRERLR